MKICLYGGLLKLVERSGIGQAVFHQKAMLESVGEEVSFHDSRDTDIVHINTVFPDSPLKAILSRLRGKRVVYYGHSTMEDFRHSFKGSDALAPLFRRWIIFCYSLGDVVITPTEYSKELLLSYGIKKPLFALSNGVDTGRFKFDAERRARFRLKYRLADSDKAVVSVGHYIERKGLIDFIGLARENPGYRFFWFGHTDLKLVPKKIRRAIETAPKNLTFPGFVGSDELTDAYCGCDLFLFMSYEETEGIVVLEALGCEIPVLVRDIPVYAGWIRDGVNAYTADSALMFQTKLDGILSGTLPSLCKAGRAAAEERSIPNIGAKLLEIYKKLGGIYA